jgi:sensor histidine kinase YesM
VTKTPLPGDNLNDIGFRVILIPFFGIAIPLITGMIDHANFPLWKIKLSYAYSIGIAFLVWEGNRYLLFTLRSYFNWFNKPIKKIAALLFAISFYTIPLSALLLVGWYHVFKNGLVDWGVVNTSTLIIMICVVFITHVYETVFLVKQAESDQLKKEQLERARAEAELEALKNQVDPHFIFNSLNTLSHLIEDKPEKAKLFNDNLAEIYRYILQNKARDLVVLKEEIEFVKHYFALLRIRFEDAVEMNIEVRDEDVEQYLIPPISLQILVENAIKHNEFSDQNPLRIQIHLEHQSLTVSNEVRKKQLRKPSSGIGLKNLDERYQLITSNKMNIQENDKEFIVSLPVLKIE